MKFVMITTIFLISFGLGDSLNAFAESHRCQTDIICVNPGNYLKYEITEGYEILHIFGEKLENNKIQYTEKGTHEDGTPYENHYALDKKTGDIFESNNLEEKYGSVDIIVPAPFKPTDPNFCEEESLVFKDKQIEVLSCVSDEKDSYIKMSYNVKTGILIEGNFKFKFDFLGESKSLETYSKLIDTNIIQTQAINSEPETQTQIDPPSLKLSTETADTSSQKIPDWIRNNAEWWVQGSIDDKDFVSGIQFLIKEGIMQIPETDKPETTETSEEIPSWIKNNADWWSQGLITDNDFVKGIQYLIEQGIIEVQI